MISLTNSHSITCPVCGNAESIKRHEDLGTEGTFCICPSNTGCGTTFILTRQGSVTDIF